MPKEHTIDTNYVPQCDRRVYRRWRYCYSAKQRTTSSLHYRGPIKLWCCPRRQYYLIRKNPETPIHFVTTAMLVLSGPRSAYATFCLHCVYTWRSGLLASNAAPKPSQVQAFTISRHVTFAKGWVFSFLRLEQVLILYYTNYRLRSGCSNKRKLLEKAGL